MQEDVACVLLAIIEGLDEHMQWPDEQTNSLVLSMTVLELQMLRNIKFLPLVDHSGHFIFKRLSLGNNDREVYTTSLIYLYEDEFFKGSVHFHRLCL